MNVARQDADLLDLVGEKIIRRDLDLLLRGAENGRTKARN